MGVHPGFRSIVGRRDVLYFGIVILLALLILMIRLFGGGKREPGKLVPRERVVTWESEISETMPSSESAAATFILDNQGRSDVHITSVESGCGCAKPVVTTMAIAPRGSTRVEVKAITPSIGSREVPIVVHTDSKILPDVSRTLRIVARRCPPFLLRIEGEPTFLGEFESGMTRVISGESIERASQAPVEIQPSIDLPFLKIDYVGISEQPTLERDSVVRTRKYLAGFRYPPPTSNFSGSIIVNDPWHEHTQLSLIVVGQFQGSGSRLRAIPSLLTLDSMSGYIGRVLIISEHPTSSLDIVLDEDHSTVGPRLIVEQDKEENLRLAHFLTIRVEQIPKNKPFSTSRLRFHVSGSDADGEIVIPVEVIS